MIDLKSTNRRVQMKTIVIAILLFVAGCQTTSLNQPGRLTKPQQQHAAAFQRSNLNLADVSGFRIKMSINDAARVLQTNSWKLDTPYTSIEDVALEYAHSRGLMRNLDQEVHYTRSVSGKREKIGLTFCGNRLMWVRSEYEIKEVEFKNFVKKARAEIGRIGVLNTDKWTNNLSYKISYNPHRLGYFYYSIYKVIKRQRGYYIWLTLHDRSHCR